MDQTGSAEWHARMLQAWHLALLRFAVMRDNADRLSVLAIANEMDRLGRPQDTTSDFGFFRRISAEFCAAVLASNDAATHVLRQHLARIDSPRLQRALAAALEIDQCAPAPIKRAVKPAGALWKGLPSRSNMRA